jgi:hypothetical protein
MPVLAGRKPLAARDGRRADQGRRPHGTRALPREFDAKYPKATAKLDKDWDALTAFYAFPANTPITWPSTDRFARRVVSAMSPISLSG